MFVRAGKGVRKLLLRPRGISERVGTDDGSGGYTAVSVCQNSSTHTLKIAKLLNADNISINLIFNFKKL